MPTEQIFNRKLLVEGNDDKHVLMALCQLHSVPENFNIIDCVGINNLLKQLPRRLKESDIETIGVIIDADIDIKARWQSLSTILTNAGFRPPVSISPGGVLIVHPESTIKIGVWIMPNNNLNGMLEDFLSFLVPHNDSLLPIANNTLIEIERQSLNKYSLAHKSKALIHTWLAWQEESGKPLGQSITMRYLNTDHETCQRLIDWIKATFSD